MTVAGTVFQELELSVSSLESCFPLKVDEIARASSLETSWPAQMTRRGLAACIIDHQWLCFIDVVSDDMPVSDFVTTSGYIGYHDLHQSAKKLTFRAC
jgi:hypothetical protein